MKRMMIFVSVIVACSLTAAVAAWAEDSPAPTPPDRSAPAPAAPDKTAAAPAPAPAPEATAPKRLPWFMMTFRSEGGGGAGGLAFRWGTYDHYVDHEERPWIRAAGWGGLTIEPFFMPTSGRGFVISPMLTVADGSGRLSNVGPVIDGHGFVYTQWTMALGLGYQWYFGDTKMTSLYLMGHLGGGRITVAVESAGWQTANMALGYLDATIGAFHRWDNGFMLGGALIWSGENFNGPTNNGYFWRSDAAGAMSMLRLGVLLGYAMP